jgi:diaminohydroxyphosphoribosylaminopyrimidine deaminase/5-amino-6-(5-phosphoribosylamino)uracil reductase
LNRRFFTFITKKRPYIILKWAETQDRYIARKDFSSKWISNALSRKLVHKWRSEEDAVMVGTNTVLYDNPRLNVREWQGRNPLRIFIDRELKTPKDFYIMDRSQPTICYNHQKSELNENLDFVKMDSTENILGFILKDLYQRKIQSLIVEGGCKLLQMFTNAELWDEARVFKSKTTFGEGICSPHLKGKIISEQVIENDELFIYQPE